MEQSVPMRILITIVFGCSVAFTSQAQMPITSALHPIHAVNDSSGLQKKWSVSMYSGIFTGAGWLNSRGAAFLSPAIGLQVNRRLNNNLYAFAGISASPNVFYPGRSFSNADYPNHYPMMSRFNTNQWDVNAGIQAGLMWMNDAKTFSISGSVGVSNQRYPFYPLTQKQPAAVTTRQ